MMTDVRRELDSLVGEDVITSGQADAIHRRLTAAGASPATHRRWVPVVAEVLGYLGGALVLVAGTLLVTEAWDSITTPGRLGLLGGVGVAFLASGLVLRRQRVDAMRRLAAFLWLLVVAAAFVWGRVLADEVLAQELPGWDRTDVETTAFGVALLVGGALWWAAWGGALPQLGAYVPLQAVLALTASRAPREAALATGITVLAVGGLWVALAWWARLRPAWTTKALGAAGVLVGSQIAATGGEARIAIGLAVAVALLTAAALTEDTILLVAAVVGVFMFVPQAVFEWFGDVIGTSLVLLTCGVVLLGVAIGVVFWRSRRDRRRGPAVGDDTGATPRVPVA